VNDKDLLELIKKRRSVRIFQQEKDISFGDIRDIIEAGIYAPSGSNTQCYRFIITTEELDIYFLSEKKLSWIKESKCCIIVYADLTQCNYLKSNRKEVFKYLPYQDCSMAMQNMLLMATAKGISSCMVHLSEEWKTAKKIKEYFGLISTDELMGIIVLGYSNKTEGDDTHAGKPVKRNILGSYIKTWRQ